MSIRKTLVAVACTAFALLGTAGTASAYATGSSHAKGYSHRHDSDPDSDVTAVNESRDSGLINIPINIPVNVCGNDISVLDILSGFGGGNANDNTCVANA